MDSVLHIEPINRPIQTPMSVGHNDFIWYGESHDDDGENLGVPSSHLRMGFPLHPGRKAAVHGEFTIGHPLEPLDVGSTRSSIPLVKTWEFAPDLTRKVGHVFTETLHYRRPDKTLIPYRSKVRSGIGREQRLTHLPSLNLIREDLTGGLGSVCDPRSHIVSELLLKDEYFKKKHNTSLSEWISNDLIEMLESETVNPLSFSTDGLIDTINRYSRTVRETSSELMISNIRDVSSTILSNYDLAPLSFGSHKPIIRPLGLFRDALVSHSHDFSSWGNIHPHKLPRMEYNPFAFQKTCELIDQIPLTDFNVDLVITPQGEIVHYTEHLAVDRFSVFADADLGCYTGKTVIDSFFEESEINAIINQFISSHSHITEEIHDILLYQSVKVKIIKTITDEAAILIYEARSQPDDPPLCGVYFDIAVQSLAPMSIIADPVLN